MACAHYPPPFHSPFHSHRHKMGVIAHPWPPSTTCSQQMRDEHVITHLRPLTTTTRPLATNIAHPRPPTTTYDPSAHTKHKTDASSPHPRPLMTTDDPSARSSNDTPSALECNEGPASPHEHISPHQLMCASGCEVVWGVSDTKAAAQAGPSPSPDPKPGLGFRKAQAAAFRPSRARTTLRPWYGGKKWMENEVIWLTAGRQRRGQDMEVRSGWRTRRYGLCLYRVRSSKP
jgi:hypothetical protein